MSFKKFSSFSKINLLLILVLLFGGIGAAAFSTEVFSFVTFADSESAAEKISKKATPKSEINAKTSTVEKATDDSEPLGAAEGKLIYGHADAPPIIIVRGKEQSGEGSSDLMPSAIFSKDPTLASAPSQLTNIEEVDPSWSFDGKRIVFVSRRDERFSTDKERNREVYIMNRDGSSQERLTGNFAAEADPAFSPDGTKIIYVGNPDNSYYPGIYSLDLMGSGTPTLLIDNADVCFNPEEGKSKIKKAASPDYPGFLGFETPNFRPNVLSGDEKIIFGYGGKIYTMNPDGTGCSVFYQTQLGGFTEPRYSPDGSKVAIVDRDEQVDPKTGETITVEYLKILDANTSEVLDSIFPDQFYSTPAWSPDGNKIAFFAGEGNFYGGVYIGTVDVNDSSQETVFIPERLPFFNGLSWAMPSEEIQPITLRINSPNPVEAGISTQGTITLGSPAPTGGASVELTCLCAVGAMTIPATVTVPEGQTQATFPISTAIADSYTNQDILAQVDFNYTFASVTISPSTPDLKAVAFTAPATALVNQSFSASWTVENISQIPTGTGYSDVIVFSTDAVVDDNDPIIHTTDQPGLAAGASRTTTKSVAIPGRFVPQAGNYFLIFVTNYNEGRDEGGKTANNFIARPVQITLPDLVAENLVAPATIEPGVSYTIQWTTRNSGTATTNATSLATVYFSNDNVAGNADDTALSTISTPILAAGASVAQLANVTIPTVPVRPTGTGFFYVKVDANNLIYEGTLTGAGETNNTIFKSVQFNYNVPDLQIASITAPPEVETDTEFAIGWTTTNAGNKNAATFSESVYYSSDSVVGSDILLGTFALNGGIAAGQSVNRIQNVTIPTGAIQTGNYFLYVRTDTSSQIDEGANELNNTLFRATRVRRFIRPDLTVTNITAPPTAFFDQTVQVQWTVTNSGQGATNTPQWKDSLYIGTSATSLSGATHLIDATSISALNPGESYTASATVKIPRGLNGAYHFIVKTNSDTAVNEESTTNNQRSNPIQLNVPPLPDLIVESVNAPDEVFGGATIDIAYTLKNQGTAATGYGGIERIYFSRDTTLNTGQDRLVFTSDERRTNMGANTTITRHSSHRRTVCTNGTNAADAPAECHDEYDLVSLPGDLQGLYYVFVVTDVYDAVYEYTNENNNVNYDRVEPGSPINVLVSPPDLVVPNQLTALSTAASGQIISTNFTVKNQGAFNAAPNLYHAVYLSADPTFDAADTLLGSIKDTNFFSPADEHPLTLNVALPKCLANGTYYLFAVADFDKRQFEFDPNFDAEANNASPPRAIQLNTLPTDLQVTNLQIPSNITPGQIIAVNWTVTNTGTGAAGGNWNDRIVLISTNPEIAPQTLASFEHIGGLAAGANYAQSKSVGLPAYMQGEYFLTVTTDYNNLVSECGILEENNAANSTHFTVQNNLPDLVVDSVNVPATAVVGDAFPVQWTGRNANGAMPANSEKWFDTVYLSTDTNFDNGDIAISSGLNELILASGQTYPKQVQAQTGNIPAGTYYVLVVADSSRKIYEGAANTAPELNNVRASSAITLTAPAVDLQIGNVSVTPPFYSGTSLGVSWTVTNLGTTQTLGARWSDYVILSRDAVIDSSDKVLGYVSRNEALAGGASYNVAGNFFVPTGLTGDYRIFVITDYRNEIIESSNANNTSLPFAVNLILPPPADLNITAVLPPATVNLGEGATFNWTVQNSGANPVSGKWRDTVYLSRDTFWDGGDTLVGVREFDSTITPVAANGGTYSGSYSGALPPVDEGTYYVIVRTDAQNRIRETNEGNNVSTSAAVTTVTITELQINQPFNTTLTNGATKFFKYTPPPFETLIVSLTTDRPARANELLTNFGTVVSRADYDFQGSRPGEGNQENVVPETGEGQYYSLVRTDYIPTSFAKNFNKTPVKSDGAVEGGNQVPDQNITVKAQILPFSIRKVSPTVAGNEGFSTLIIEGAKFQTGATVKLVGADNSQILPIQSAVATSKIAALFDLKGKAAGDYDVVVTNPSNQTTTLADGFRIVTGGGHSIRETILGPKSLRTTHGGRTRYSVSIANDGFNDARHVPVLIKIPRYPFELDRHNYLEPQASWLPIGADLSQIPLYFDTDDGERVLFFMIPILASHSSVEIGFDLTVPFGSSAGFDISVAALPPLAEMLLAGSDPSGGDPEGRLHRPGIANENACWLELARAFAFAVVKELVGEYVKVGECVKTVINLVLNGADIVTGAGLLAATDGGSISGLGAFTAGIAKIVDLASTATNFLKDNSDCLKALSKAAVPWLKTLSGAITIFQLFLQLVDCLSNEYYIYTVNRYQPIDPNEKIAPEGYGAERFVPVKQPMLYRINFENLSTATAPAQRIFISDELPATLDPRTVRLKEIGFKQNRIVVDDNQAFYQSRIQLDADLNNLQADVIAGLDIVNRRVFWTLSAIDPQTGEQPIDALVGLLPPNNASRDGEGYVIFTVEPTATMPTRTEINNLATIIFDENEPIVTNTTINLLDSGIPTSVLATLPATSVTPTFNLNWTGGDDANGSGLKGFDVLFSEDGKAYSPFLSNSAETGGTFNGKWGKSYRFYSVARDNAGNVEMPPVQPDATIQIFGGDTEADVAPRPNGSDGQLNDSDTNQIRRFVANLDTNYLYNEFQRADVAPLADGGDGALSAADVMQTRRFVANLDPLAEAFGPNELLSFSPKLISGRTTRLPREIRPVRVSRSGNKLIVAIELEAQGDETAAGFTLNFNTAHLANPSNITLGGDANGAVLTVNTSQTATGKLGILLDKAPNQPIAANARRLVNIEFDILANPPANTLLSFDDSLVKRQIVDGTAAALTTTFSAGTISLLAPTAATVGISGRVLANNQGVYPAFVDLTDSAGNRRIAPTNPSGNYRFDNVAVGQTYVFEARSKRHQFAPRVINVTGEMLDLDFAAR